MEFQDVLRRRRMVRAYDTGRQVPPDVLGRILHNALRAPSAGFIQSWAFLVLDNAEDIVRFRTAATPDDGSGWLSARIDAPMIIVPHSNRDAYLDRYAQPDKGHTRSEDAWSAPYWDIDAGMASLLMLLTAVDSGLGACFFGIPRTRFDAYRTAFDVPDAYTPIGAIAVGYPAEPAPDYSHLRRPSAEFFHRGRWGERV
jgi:nitroreductase